MWNKANETLRADRLCCISLYDNTHPLILYSASTAFLLYAIMMSPFSFCIAIMVLLHFHFSFVNGCSEDERSYLLDFRSWLNDSSARLNSWQQFNCCQWEGVICDYPSGHVVSLDLKNRDRDSSRCWERDDLCTLSGKIHPSLFNLQHLQYLDLSMNDFKGTPIPPQLAKLQRLTFLSLAAAQFEGEIPLELGNITTLRHLDLLGIYNGLYLRHNGLESRRFGGWITSLRRLEYLDMSFVNLSMANDHSRTALRSLPNLREIYLFQCGLSGRIPPLLNLSHLSHLNLSANSFNSSIPAWFQNVSSLVSLDLSWNDLGGSIPSNFLHRSSRSLRTLDLSENYNLGGVIPHFIANFSVLENLKLSSNNLSGDLPPFGTSSGQLSSLRSLDLHNNQLSGTIPSTISKISTLESLVLGNNQLSGEIPRTILNISSLRYLDLGYNQLSGEIPHAFSKLVRLEKLLLSSNHLTGHISLSILADLAHLKEVGFSENQLTVNISSSLVPQFSQLGYLGLSSCNVQGEIPPFLSTLYSLAQLDLSHNNVVGNIPTWLWELPNLEALNLSHNQLEGSLPPVISMNMFILDLHNNSLHASIPDCGVTILDISENRFNGSIPESICSDPNQLDLLDLSKNRLSGAIPKTLARCSSLIVLNLAQNYLEGEMPEELGNMAEIETLNLSENNLQGLVPPTIASCAKLRVFDIGKNRFQGSIPAWIGELAELRVLNLAFNNFKSTFPFELLSLKNLQILDLSHNNISGLIPKSFGKLNAMRNQTQTDKAEMSSGEYGYEIGAGPSYDIEFMNQVTLWIKGRFTPYTKIIGAFKFMDLSYNNFSGSIPEEMGELKGLIALNISNNNLTGPIPAPLGGMAQLESLDLSGNILSGNVPADLVNLTFLSYLNLSYNHLSGIIPRGKQFDTFEASSYVGNPNLHGWPLENGTLKSGTKERGSQVQANSTGAMDGAADEMDRWWAVSVGLCFGVGFASVIAVLCFQLKWRYKCFALQDRVIRHLFEH